jgi:hypothetical protein
MSRLMDMKINGDHYIGMKHHPTKYIGMKSHEGYKYMQNMNKISAKDMSDGMVNSHNNIDVKNEPIHGIHYKHKEKHYSIEKAKKKTPYHDFYD